MGYTQFPISIRQTVVRGCQTDVINDEHLNPDGTAMDFSGYTFAGQVRTTPDASGTLLASLDFTGSDLVNGVVLAVLVAADSDAVIDGATQAGADGVTLETYCSVIATNTLGVPRCWYQVVLPCEESTYVAP